VLGAGVRRFGGPVEVLELPGPRELRPDEVLIEVQARVTVHSAPLRDQGAWAGRHIAAAAQVAVLPTGVPVDAAAALPCSGPQAVSTPLAKGEGVGLGAGVGERDLEGSLGDRAGLADELV
jgi:hypothetical protein